MRNFLQRNAVLVTGLAIAAAILAVILGILLSAAGELQQETIQRFDQENRTGDTTLPGPRGQVSYRSKRQLVTLLANTPHVLGGWIIRLDFEKDEVPFVHYWSGHPVVTEAVNAFAAAQRGGSGTSSEEFSKDPTLSIRNSDEARNGLIKCGKVEETNLPQLAPSVLKVVKGVCRASIPPFDENVNMAIVVLLDIDANENSPELQAVRRVLLQLQIDIFNRDYQGRETWATP